MLAISFVLVLKIEQKKKDATVSYGRWDSNGTTCTKKQCICKQYVQIDNNK